MIYCYLKKSRKTSFEQSHGGGIKLVLCFSSFRKRVVQPFIYLRVLQIFVIFCQENQLYSENIICIMSVIERMNIIFE
jgi:hypothetical protein